MRLKLSGVVLAIAGLAQSQNIDPTPSEFEVATIKPSTFDPGPRWFRFIDARRWTAFNVETMHRTGVQTSSRIDIQWGRMGRF
jgi:hypothetical protein